MKAELLIRENLDLKEKLLLSDKSEKKDFA